jgi:AcrR family transcriptional regulator
MGRITKDPEERKKELIDAAERLFIAVGYDQTAISDIVREVNVSQGAFYYYFDSKEEVLMAVMEKEIAAMEADLIRIAQERDMDEAVKLNSMINWFIRPDDPGKKILGYIHEIKSKEMHEKHRRKRPFSEIAPVMAKVISLGIQKGRFSVNYPLETSYLLLMLLGPALHIFYRSMAPGESKDQTTDEVFRENMRSALEDLLGKMLGVSDYRFVLKLREEDEET